MAERSGGEATARPLVLLDCDPGHDDVLAMIVAARHCELVGVTTVAGNAPLERTTHNACVMRDLLGLDVEVHAGAARPLVAEPRAAASVHGESGLDGADLPAPQRPADSADAVRFIVDTCRRVEGVTLVATGPLTNVALALRAAPDVAGRLAGISIMGGGTFGNRTPTAEFNVWADPEAAAVVFETAAAGEFGGPLTMAGLDVTHRFLATPERIDAVASIGGTLATTLAGLLGFFSAAYRANHDPGAMPGAAMHDPLAVLAVTHPELFTIVERHVAVETAGGAATRGMTVIDQRTLRERAAPNARVLVDVDDAAAFAVLAEAVRSFA